MAINLPHQRPLRIALLGYRSNPFSGGQGVYLKYVSRALRALGHQVDVISGEPYPELDDGIRLIKLPGLNLFELEEPWRGFEWRFLHSATDLFEWASIASGGFPEPETFGRRVYRYLLDHKDQYDIVHDNQSLSYGVRRLQAVGMPVVTTIHHPITRDRDIALANEPRKSLRLLLRRWYGFLRMQTKVARSLRHIITVSEFSRQDLARQFGADPDHVTVIHNGVDCDEFRPIPTVARDPNRLITTASADQPLKGTQHLLPAFATLRECHPDLRLTFVGRPKPGGSTERQINALGLQHAIDFHHGIGSCEIVQLYAQASIAIVPSEYEGFGLPAAEAMACGVPVVSSDGGALPEVVGKAGIVVPRANPGALADAIDALLRDPVRREALGHAGRQRMLQYFNWSTVADQLTDYYRRVIAQ